MKYRVDYAEAFAWLGLLQAESVDLVITDPPYASLEKHRSVGTTTRLKKEWFEVITNEQLFPMMGQFYRVLRKNRHCYILCDFDTMLILSEAGKTAGFKLWKAIVWDKMRMGMGYHYRNRHEYILFFEKGKRKLNGWGNLESIQYVPGIRGMGHYPTEKPVALLRVFIKASTQPDELVLDPFCGSGSTGVAALQLGRYATLCDNNEKAVLHSRERLGKENSV